MKNVYYVLTFVIMLLSVTYSQEKVCIYFPLKINNTWNYNSTKNPNSLISKVIDTATINEHLYYGFVPNVVDSNNILQKYWLRPEPNKIFALNVQDSSEYVLFNFDAEIGQSWEIPPVITPPSNAPINQCDWGSTVTLLSNTDTVYNSNRTFYNCYHFGHLNHTCYDAGIYDTWFSRDFGIVRFAQITIAGVLDWKLVLNIPDTIALLGIYKIMGNPCLTVPCIPGVVSAVLSNNTKYILTKNDNWFDGDFSWNGYNPLPDDSVLVKGISTNRTDIFGNQYFTFEVLEFSKYIPTTIYDNNAELMTTKYILNQNYPNPFNPSTMINYAIPKASYVTIKIYNMLGKDVATLVNQNKEAGNYSVDFNASNLSSGLYIYRIQAGSYIAAKKMVLMK